MSSEPLQLEQLLTVDEVARILRVSRSAIYDLIAQGKLRRVPLGNMRKTRVHPAEVRHFLAAGS